MQDENAGRRALKVTAMTKCRWRYATIATATAAAELVYKASWRYVSTSRDPFTSFHKTKMDWLTKPMEETASNRRSRLTATTAADLLFCFGLLHACDARSLQIKPAVEMTDKEKKARKIRTSAQCPPRQRR